MTEDDDATREVRWLDDDEQRAWRAILRGTHLVTLAMEEALAPHGVSLGEYELLSMVAEAPDRRRRMAELADLVVQSRSRVSHTASRLERRGWVRRLPTADDRRGVVLSLTDEGYAVVRRLAPVHVASVRAALLDHLDRDHLLAHGEQMRRVVRANRASEDQAGDAA
ncbi:MULTISPECIES: MarR family winged helix-turn-helix transcriptional regulator [Ornithinimicrobium]|uniref:MarR family winged helix-turn-helix transcriptional regulator n=2 Tax=Ornithinimicrobium kibberense TaxID=282060 RepID=A0ABV5V119_9MICO|nr:MULTISPECIES: MarR family transcriptional regulator [Ornithinimicrobium]OLT22994.1 transcriptional regulator [Ornithinimicrobium sp. CNJ-824]